VGSPELNNDKKTSSLLKKPVKGGIPPTENKVKVKTAVIAKLRLNA
tara:strand:- start:216 stop:353 length:138 start_codon:yes stop_codon:yes gene_type:complete